MCAEALPSQGQAGYMERVGRGPGRPHWEPVTPCLTTFSVLTMMLLLAEPVVSQANPGDLWLAGIAAAAGVARADSCHDLAAAQSYECKAAGGAAPLGSGCCSTPPDRRSSRRTARRSCVPATRPARACRAWGRGRTGNHVFDADGRREELDHVHGPRPEEVAYRRYA